MSRIATIIVVDRSGVTRREPVVLPFEIMRQEMTRDDVTNAIEKTVAEWLGSKDGKTTCNYVDGDFSYLDLGIYEIPAALWQKYGLRPMWTNEDIDIYVDMADYIVTGVNTYTGEE